MNEPDVEGFTPLMVACAGNGAHLLWRFMQEPNLDVNLSNDDGITALFVAIASGDLVSVNALLTYPGIDVNHISNKGQSPLCKAVQVYPNIHMAVSLINHGADLDYIPPVSTQSLFAHFATKFPVTALEMLGNRKDIEVPIEVIDFFVNDKDFIAATPFIKYKFPLTEGGKRNYINWTKTYDTDSTPFLLQIVSRPIIDINFLSTLIDYGYDLLVKNSEGETALHIALNSNNKIATRILLKHKAYEITAKGDNILHQAVMSGALDQIPMILKYLSQEDHTVLLGQRNNAGKTVLLLLTNMYSFGSFMNPGTIQLLCTSGVNVNDTDTVGNTAIFYCIKAGHYECTKMLLDHQAAVDIKNEDGETPLFFAVRQQQYQIVELLLEAGADTHAINSKNEPIIMHANALSGATLFTFLRKHKQGQPGPPSLIDVFNELSSLETSQVNTLVRNLLDDVLTSLQLFPSEAQSLNDFRKALVSHLKSAKVGIPRLKRDLSFSTLSSTEMMMYISKWRKMKQHCKAVDDTTLWIEIARGEEQVRDEELKEPALTVPGLSIPLPPPSDFSKLHAAKFVDPKFPHDQQDLVYLLQHEGYLLDAFLTNGKNNILHVLQAIVSEDQNNLKASKTGTKYLLWSRWNEEQTQSESEEEIGKKLQEYATQDELIEAFKSEFEAKTKNLWDNRSNFEHQPDCFFYIPASHYEDEHEDQKIDEATNADKEEMSIGEEPDSSNKLPQEIKTSQKGKEKMEIEEEETENSTPLMPGQLDKRVLNLLNIISNKKLLCGVEDEQSSVRFTFGKEKISPLQIRNGYNILSALSDIVKYIKTLKQRGQPVPQKYNDALEELSNKFYCIIPYDISVNSTATLEVINSEKLIAQKIRVLESIKDIGLALSLIDKAEIQSKEATTPINTAQLLYKALNAKLTPLDKSSDFYKVIAEDIMPANKIKVFDIFEVEREEENSRYAVYSNLPNKTLLFHGTRVESVMGILKKGFQIAPKGVPSSGQIFGKGIYFADLPAKSKNYMQLKDGFGFMFICEVALGKSYEAVQRNRFDENTPLPPGYHSVWGKGKSGTTPETSIYTYTGVRLPTKMAKRNNALRLNYNEFVVYNADQVKIRYLVKITNKQKK